MIYGKLSYFVDACAFSGYDAATMICYDCDTSFGVYAPFWSSSCHGASHPMTISSFCVFFFGADDDDSPPISFAMTPTPMILRPLNHHRGGEGACVLLVVLPVAVCAADHHDVHHPCWTRPLHPDDGLIVGVLYQESQYADLRCHDDKVGRPLVVCDRRKARLRAAVSRDGRLGQLLSYSVEYHLRGLLSFDRAHSSSDHRHRRHVCLSAGNHHIGHYGNGQHPCLLLLLCY
jgi:hypothetical protein